MIITVTAILSLAAINLAGKILHEKMVGRIIIGAVIGLCFEIRS